MRKDFDRQLNLDVPALDQIDFDPRSRHELEAILMALKHLYDSPQAMRSVLRLIAADIGQAELGCQGLAYWEILVLAAVRLGADLDYDALADLATNHRKLRALMGVGEWHTKKYARSTIHDNVKKLKPETLRAISRVIVGLGHTLEPKAIKRMRGDSFVVQTNIHY
ncbi:ISNCY family transposase, partial [bacterium]|nr:ISNCY family transposase [bacterium]